MSALLGSLPKIAGAVVGITTLAYAVGLAESFGFFFRLGAPWAVALLTPTQVMQAGSIPALLIAGVSIPVAVNYFIGAVQRRTLLRVAASICLISTVLMAITLISGSWFSGGIIQYCFLGACFSLAVCVGVMTGITIGKYLLGKLHPDWNLLSITFASSLSLLAIPFVVGSASANLQADSGSAGFPNVSTRDGKDLDWRLAGAVGDHLLLVSFNAKHVALHLQVVKPEAVVDIRPLD